MKKLLLLIALLLLTLSVPVRGEKKGLQEEPKINVGIKGGFNSSMYFTSRLELDGERMEDVQNNYRLFRRPIFPGTHEKTLHPTRNDV